MSKRSSKHTSSSPVVRFLKEWGLFSIIVGLIIASRIFLWAPVKVDGHSMDPTLADSEYLLVVNHLSIDRFDIVVASEKDDDGKTKDIVKRVIGLPGDTIQYDNDTLYINGKKTNEPYLKDYIARFKKDKIAIDLHWKRVRRKWRTLPPIGQYSPSIYSRQGWQS